jgi:hypothetical protein
MTLLQLEFDGQVFRVQSSLVHLGLFNLLLAVCGRDAALVARPVANRRLVRARPVTVVLVAARLAKFEQQARQLCVALDRIGISSALEDDAATEHDDLVGLLDVRDRVRAEQACAVSQQALGADHAVIEMATDLRFLSSQRSLLRMDGNESHARERQLH